MAKTEAQRLKDRAKLAAARLARQGNTAGSNPRGGAIAGKGTRTKITRGGVRSTGRGRR